MALREGTAAVPVQVTCEAGGGACARPEWGAAAEAARKAPKAWGGHVDPGVPSFRLASRVRWPLYPCPGKVPFHIAPKQPGRAAAPMPSLGVPAERLLSCRTSPPGGSAERLLVCRR